MGIDNNLDKHANKDSSGSSNVWQARNDGYNYAGAHCDDRRQTFCEDVPYYPQDFVNRMLTENSNLLYYAHEDVVSRPIIIVYSRD